MISQKPCLGIILPFVPLLSRLRNICLFALCLSFVVVSGCAGVRGGGFSDDADHSSPVDLPTDGGSEDADSAGALIGVWLPYYELTFQGCSEQEFEARIDAMFADIADLGCNAVFCHVRPFADSCYPSAVFPWSNAGSNSVVPQGTDPGYDPFAVMVRCAIAHKLAIHAWINPYRVATGIDASVEPWSVLAENHPVRLWMTDGDADNDGWVSVYRTVSGGVKYKNISLNPAVPEVQKLILDGIREILDNYDVDGIHFDDYFYPTRSAGFDEAVYSAYRNDAGDGALGLDEWRRANVSALVSGVCSLVRSYGKVFGISPAAAISNDHTDRNYTDLYADIALWMSGSGYVDYIMPQLYFGFEYPDGKFRFDHLLDRWMSMPRHSSVKLYTGLAAYKIGTVDAGSSEWRERDDILARQAGISFRRCDGFVLFSYSSLSGTPLRDAQKSKLKTFIKNYIE